MIRGVGAFSYPDERYVTRAGKKSILNIACDQGKTKGYLRGPCGYYIVIFGTGHQFLGITVIIICSYWNYTSVSRYPCRFYIHWNLSLVSGIH